MYLFAGSWILFLFGIIAIIFAINGYPIMYTVYSGLMALLFSMFLVYDTQQVMAYEWQTELTKKYDMIKNNIMKMGKTLSEGFALNPFSNTEITSNLSFIVILDMIPCR